MMLQTGLCLAATVAVLLFLLIKYYQRVLLAPNRKPLTRTTGTQTQQKSGRNKANSKPPHPSDRIGSKTTSRGIKSEQEGYLASGSNESLSSEDGKTHLKRKHSNIEKHQARPQSFSGSTDSESHTSGECRRERSSRPPNALPPATVHSMIICEGPGIKSHNGLCSGIENQSSSDGEYFQPLQEQNPDKYCERVCGHPTAHEHIKTQPPVKDRESNLSELQASIQDMLEAHLEKQKSIVSEEHKLQTVLIERQRIEIEELKKVLAERDHQIEKRDNKIKEKDLEIKERECQIQKLQEGSHPAMNKQNREERVNPEITRRNKLEKGFLFFL